MTIHVNEAAVKNARSMIAAGKIDTSDSDRWSSSKPDAKAENAFIEKHGWSEYAKWHLAYDDSENDETKGRYKFPFGDFTRVHRSGVIAAEQRAASEHDRAVQKAAADLKALIDGD